MSWVSRCLRITDGLYRFSYLSPPWGKALRQQVGLPVYVIDPNDNPLPVRGMPGDGIGARISLEVEVVGDTTVQEASEADLAAWQAEGAVAEPSEQFENRAGDVGVRVFVEATDRWITAAYFGLDGNGVVAMKIAGNDDDLQSDDMTLLLRGLEPMAAEGD